jgi:prefoldin subunit 5
MSQYYTQGFPDTYANARGIPRVEFVSDVANYLKQKDCNPESLLSQMQDNYSKYKLMEYKLGQNKISLKNKIPEIKKTLEMVRHLKAKVEADEALETSFGISENVFVSAIIKSRPETVGLWLGANVMVQYTYDEAIALLQKNMQSAIENLNHVFEDLAFLRDQLTTSEVNIARVYNYDVKLKRKTTTQSTTTSMESSTNA